MYTQLMLYIGPGTILQIPQSPSSNTASKCYMGRNRAREEEWVKRDKDAVSQSPTEDNQRADKVKEV